MFFRALAKHELFRFMQSLHKCADVTWELSALMGTGYVLPVGRLRRLEANSAFM